MHTVSKVFWAYNRASGLYCTVNHICVAALFVFPSNQEFMNNELGPRTLLKK